VVFQRDVSVDKEESLDDEESLIWRAIEKSEWKKRSVNEVYIYVYLYIHKCVYV
jgi:hypothetical protein